MELVSVIFAATMDGTLVADERVELKRSLKLLDLKSCPQIAFRLQVGKKQDIKGHTRDDDDPKKDNGIETTLQRPISGLLRLPVELRLKIYRHIFCEALRICPHSNLPRVILARKVISRKTCYYWNPILRCQLLPSLVPAYLDTPLPVLGINRQINAEVGESCVFFLEKCFTHFDERTCRPSNDPHKVKEILKNYDPDLCQCVRRLGFSINQLPDVFTRNRDREIVPFQNGLRWIDRHMPHLEYIYIALFIKREHHSRMSFAGFLAALIVSLKAMKGQKVIIVYGTNKAKVAVANQ